mgnify:CR=1 FL=1
MIADIIIGVVILAAVAEATWLIWTKIQATNHDNEERFQQLYEIATSYHDDASDRLDTVEKKIDMIDLPAMVELKEEESIMDNKQRVRNFKQQLRDAREREILNG